MRFELLKEAEKYFVRMIGIDEWGMFEHAKEVEKWVGFLCRENKELDKLALLCAVWLHDISVYQAKDYQDHAKLSAIMAKKFLEQHDIGEVLLNRIIKIILFHRNSMSNSAEIIAFAAADSASHISSKHYFDIAAHNDLSVLRKKFYRDLRDIQNFPQISSVLKHKIEAWNTIILSYR